MERDANVRRIKSMVWGFFLMAVGGAFLLARLGWTSMPPVGRLWPAVFLVIAALHVVERRLGAAVMFLLMGGCFFACEFGWWGLTYHNIWPLLLVAAGIGMVMRALGGEPPLFPRKRSES